ncbi:hypothetical protein [Brevundimonas aveniformis]|uniref:hypothetical protein n=1 Tax=Brevundimonas aveniformis TaxID=370977 RepID=UPI000407E7E7|nr:hypothetical protein [Brevundimonas aveniformis]
MSKLTIILAGIALATAGSATAQDYRLPEGVRLPGSLLDLRPANGLSWVTCNVVEVAAFQDRAHVRCANGEGVGTARLPPAYIAVDIQTHPGLASSLTTLGVRARTTGTPLYALIFNNAGVNPPGCDAGNCRGAMGFVIE